MPCGVGHGAAGATDALEVTPERSAAVGVSMAPEGEDTFRMWGWLRAEKEGSTRPSLLSRGWPTGALMRVDMGGKLG